jgi:hypothetical protein
MIRSILLIVSCHVFTSILPFRLFYAIDITLTLLYNKNVFFFYSKCSLAVRRFLYRYNWIFLSFFRQVDIDVFNLETNNVRDLHFILTDRSIRDNSLRVIILKTIKIYKFTVVFLWGLIISHRKNWIEKMFCIQFGM